MFCPNCRANLPDDSTFCTNCGYNLSAGAAGVVGAVGGASSYGGSPFRNSTWDGGVLDTIVNSIVASFMMLCTCYIATPWAICYLARYILQHTVIEGKRLRFDGDGGSLFGEWLKWLLLTVITCGIYSFWVIPRLYKWIASHIHYEN